MTMRLDIVTNDAGELVRREHARELGAGVVVSIYRLAKLAQLHDLTNQAFLRQLEDAHKLIQDYCLRSGSNVSILFAAKAIFVAGQLLKGSRGTYESASELAEILEWCGGSELSITRDVTLDELRAFAEAISGAMRSEKGKGFHAPSTRIRLRPVADAARLRGLEIEDLTLAQRIVRAYASAVVIMRRFLEDLREGRYLLPKRVKRIAQNLVDLSEGTTPAFLGVTEARNANHDDAGRAVNSAILAVAVAREMTDDRALLSQIAMAAMMHDVGRPRAIAIAASSGPQMTGVVARLSEDAEDKLAAGTAAVLTALGRVNEATVTRTVIAYEALWYRRAAFLGPLYEGLRATTLQAKIVAIARRYNDLLTPEPGLDPPVPDFAVATLFEELKAPADRTVLRMLVAAVGLYPVGTVVQLDTSEIAEVLSTPERGDRRRSLDKPRVRVVIDARGAVLSAPFDIDLAAPALRPSDPKRSIVKVVSVDGWRKGLAVAEAQGATARAHSEAPISAPPDTYAPESLVPASLPVSSYVPEPYDASADRASSVPSSNREEPPSVGTSPSAVAQSFGRQMSEPPRARPSVRPVTLGPPAVRSSDRTVVQASPHQRDPSARAAFPIPEGALAGAPRNVLADKVPSAMGTLAATPLVHVLVYMLDHTLSGTVVFREPDESESLVYFFEGAPAKIKTHRQVALLGDELALAGLVDRDVVAKALESAKRLGAMLGEYVVGNHLLTEPALVRTLQRQLKKKLVSMVNALPDTTYSFYRDTNALHDWAGDVLVDVHPLDAILACSRGWHDRARIHATLGRIGKQPLALHADVDLAALDLTADEEAALAILRGESPNFTTLNEMQVADEDSVSSLVYMLAVTRQFAFAKGDPMGREHSTRARSAPRESSPGERVSALPIGAIVEPFSRASVFPSNAAAVSAPPAPVTQPSDDELDVDVEIDEVPRPPDSALQAMTDFRLAETALQRSDLKTAEFLAARAVEGEPERGDYAALLAWIVAAKATSKGGATVAIDALSKILEKEPRNERALLYRGKVLKRANRIKEALRDFDAILEVNPKHLEAASEARLLRARKPLAK